MSMVWLKAFRSREVPNKLLCTVLICFLGCVCIYYYNSLISINDYRLPLNGFKHNQHYYHSILTKLLDYKSNLDSKSNIFTDENFRIRITCKILGKYLYSLLRYGHNGRVPPPIATCSLRSGAAE